MGFTDKRRSVVYAREYTGNVWTVEHKIPDDRLFVYISDPNFRTVVPKKIEKKDINTVEITFKHPFHGNASVMRVSPVTKWQRYNFNNFTSGNVQHVFNNKNYITQFWDTNDQVVYPKEVRKINNKLIFVDFKVPFTGYMEMVRDFRGARVFNNLEEWTRRGVVESPLHSFLQTEDSDDRQFVAGREQRFDTVPGHVNDNLLVAEFNGEQSGRLRGLVFGIRI